VHYGQYEVQWVCIPSYQVYAERACHVQHVCWIHVKRVPCYVRHEWLSAYHAQHVYLLHVCHARHAQHVYLLHVCHARHACHAQHVCLMGVPHG